MNEGAAAVSDGANVSVEGAEGAVDGQSGATVDAIPPEVGHLPGTADEEGRITPVDATASEEEAR